MRKILLMTILAVFTFSAANAQKDMVAGVSLALPVGDAGDFYSFGINADIAYYFDITPEFAVGPALGLLYYMGKDIKFMGEKVGTADDALYLPIAGSARYYFDNLFIGADLGYGLGLAPKGNDGGLFYRPKVGYYFDSMGVVASYLGVNDSGFTFSSINIGVEFMF